MKNIMHIAALAALFSSLQLFSCPTCIGRIEQESPPFFSDEFYQPGAESMHYLYEQLLAEEKDASDRSSDQEAT